MRSGNESPWYSAGLQFECQQCGACCKAPGHVFLTPPDIARMAAKLDPKSDSEEAIANFQKRFTINAAGQRLAKREDGACVLLGEDDRCMAYRARPLQCSTFPWWKGVLEYPANWATAGDTCPGVGNGHEWRAHEIEEVCALNGRKALSFGATR